jgi:hypothetical protein
MSVIETRGIEFGGIVIISIWNKLWHATRRSCVPFTPFRFTLSLQHTIRTYMRFDLIFPVFLSFVVRKNSS